MSKEIKVDNRVLKTDVFKNLGAKGLAIYFYLVRYSNIENVTITSLKFIFTELGIYNDSKSKKEILDLLIVMNDIDIIELNSSLDGISINDMIVITVTCGNRYTKFYPKDFEFIKKFGKDRFYMFAIYCIIIAYHNKDYGYSFPPMDKIVEIGGFSKETVHKYVHLLEELEIIDIDNNGWRYDVIRGKHIRCNNMYYINYEGKKKIFNMPTDEVLSLIEDIKSGVIKRGKYHINEKFERLDTSSINIVHDSQSYVQKDETNSLDIPF